MSGGGTYIACVDARADMPLVTGCGQGKNTSGAPPHTRPPMRAPCRRRCSPAIHATPCRICSASSGTAPEPSYPAQRINSVSTRARPMSSSTASAELRHTSSRPRRLFRREACLALEEKFSRIGTRARGRTVRVCRRGGLETRNDARGPRSAVEGIAQIDAGTRDAQIDAGPRLLQFRLDIYQYSTSTPNYSILLCTLASSSSSSS
ncbi:hypothetical protein FB451DRAFT_1411308 [Mycena latifolia]|nr:hypothetical protein FB451DRAFT_1411308 [Mycena latifolia]